MDFLDDVNLRNIQHHLNCDILVDVSDPIAKVQKNAVWTPIILTKLITNTDPARVQSLSQGDLIDRLCLHLGQDQLHRSLSVQRIKQEVGKQQDPHYLSKANLLQLLGPLLVQQYEGPLRYELAALMDILKSFRAGQGDWRSELFRSENMAQKEDLESLLIKARGELEAITLAMGNDALLKILNVLMFDEDTYADLDLLFVPDFFQYRNCLVNADYWIEQRREGKLEVKLFFKNQVLVKPIGTVLTNIHAHLICMSYLAVGLSLATVEAAFANKVSMEKALGLIQTMESGYPPSFEEDRDA